MALHTVYIYIYTHTHTHIGKRPFFFWWWYRVWWGNVDNSFLGNQKLLQLFPC